MKPAQHKGLTICAVLLLFATAGFSAEMQFLKGHVPRAVKGLQPIEPLAPGRQLDLAIALPLRNRKELDSLLRELYDPASPRFRQYLTPDQFCRRFGPTEKNYQALIDFARSKGLTVTDTYGSRTLLDVRGSVGQIEKTFHLKLMVYRHPTGKRTFFAPDVEPSVEAPVTILAVDGLDDVELPQPMDLKRRSVEESAMAEPYTTGSGPWGNFIGGDFRAAYARDVSLEGAGESVGLVAFDGYYASDIAAYESLAGLPDVPLVNVLVRNFSGRPGVNNVEVALDIEMAIAMAPGLSNVVVYEGLFPNDILTRMAESGAPRQLSSSWRFSVNAATEDLFRQFAAQGQSFFQASGDSGAWLNGIDPPSDDPNLTIVGGTTLTTSGPGGPWLSETVWPGSGGGISTNYAIPNWQHCLDMSSAQGSTTMRNIPDVACVADISISVVANHGEHLTVGGTSASAPLWAGFAALANQQAAAEGRPAIGFLNPTLYAIGKTQGQPFAFHDITTGNNTNTSNRYFAVPGYDLCTGWGTPAGSSLIAALVEPPTAPHIVPSGVLTFSGPTGGPFSTTPQGFTVRNDEPDTMDWAVSNSADWLEVSPAGGTLPTCGSVTAALELNSSASNLAAGTYTATLWFTNLSNLAAQSRKVILDVVTPPVISSQPVDQVLFEGMTATFNVSVSNPASVTYRWQQDNGSYVTNVSDNATISGSTSSTLTIRNVSAADVGAYWVVVSNASGEVSSSIAYLVIVPWRPLITMHPTNQTAVPGQPIALTVAATGTEPLSYYWRKEGVDLTGTSSSPSLLLSNVSASDAGTYSVIVSNTLGVALSSDAVLTVVSNTSPEISLETVYSFSGGNDGGSPNGLLAGSNGVLYGTARKGGSSGWGTVFAVSADGMLSTLYSFTGGTDGAEPRDTLLRGPDANFYSTTIQGGLHGVGTIFRMSSQGTLLSLLPFNGGNGALPTAGLILGADDNFYGTTYSGGAKNGGTVFKVPSSGSLTTLHSFSGASDGANPYAGVVQGTDGNFYGATYKGGPYGQGTVFSMSANGEITTLVSFNYTNGAFPYAGVIQGDDGNFYGSTAYGGADGYGVIFRISPSGVFTSLYTFTGGRDGGFPFAALLLGSDGNYYGSTAYGGAYRAGTLFRMAPDGTVVTMAEFDSYDGANPQSALVEGEDGNLYGTTIGGGPAGQGTVFRFSIVSGLAPQITSQPISRAVFTGADVTFAPAVFGSRPLSYQWLKYGTNLVDAGNLSGSTSRILSLADVTLGDAGGYSVVVTNTWGSVTSAVAVLEVEISPPILTLEPASQTLPPGATTKFKVRSTGSLPLRYQWQFNGADLADAGNISGSATDTLILSNVVETNNGVYSVTVSNEFGSTNSQATLTVIPPSPACTRLATLFSFGGGNEGAALNGLGQGTDGNFYGTTEFGGASNLGTVFRMTPAGAVSTLFAFAGPDGAHPKAELVQGSDGSFYGTTYAGGPGGYGTVFKVTTGGALTTLVAFDYENGANPRSALLQATDGNLYGTASDGGPNTNGTIFRISVDGTFTNLVSFDGTNGARPYAGLFETADGQFYGTTHDGGAYAYGTVFKLTRAGTLTSLYSFSTNGATTMPVPVSPVSPLVQGPDGALYGTTESGFLRGIWFPGNIYRITTNGLLDNLYALNSYDGHDPRAGLVLGPDGNFYGTTYTGPGFGTNGTVFRVTPDGVLTTLITFDQFNDGAGPQAPLLLAADGNFYGTTSSGGWAGQGTVFRLSIAPQIISQPIDQVAFIGGSVIFGVDVSGSPLVYQWLQNGTNLADGPNVSGSATPTLTLSHLTADDNQNSYSVVVNNSLFADPGCARTSAVALLIVTSSPPIIVSQPVTQTLPPGATAIFTVSAIGNEPLSYQWQFDGTDITGATNSSLTLTAVQTADAGNYRVWVSNDLGTVGSSAAGLRVLAALGWTKTATNVLALTWTDPYVLQSATNAAGPYFDMPGATSPYLVAPTSLPHEFFRLRALEAGSLTATVPEDHEFGLGVGGLRGYNYIIEASTNLTSWLPIQTNPAPFIYVDPGLTNYPQRFYRTIFGR